MKISHTYAVIALALIASSCTSGLHKSIGETFPRIEEPTDLYEDLLSRRADRAEVEMIALLGPRYKDTAITSDPEFIQTVRNSLEHEQKYLGSPYGTRLYRVVRIEEVESILQGTWPSSLFNEKLKALFQKHQYASLVIMEGDDQRIFFFDKQGKFVAIYPR